METANNNTQETGFAGVVDTTTDNQRLIYDQVNSEIEKSEKELEERIANIRNRNKKLLEKAQILIEKLPAIESVLQKAGLKMQGLGYSKRDSDIWREGDSLRVSFIGVPEGDKFKFIFFNGYTAGGCGKNQDRLNAKAKKLEQIIKDAAGIESVGVNQYSLEIKDKNENKRVMFSLWIK